MRKTASCYCIFLLIMMCSSCATIVSKTSYPVSFGSEPAGTAITVTNKKNVEVFKGKTPYAIKLKTSSGFFSREQYTIRFSRPGYEDRIVPINFKLNGWYFGNLLFGGLLGMLIIDPATGAMWRIEQDEFFQKYTDEDKKAGSAQPTLNIVTVGNVPDSLKSRMVRIN